MSQDLKETGKIRCYSCIQWDGKRTYYPEKKLIKVDVSSEGKCRISGAKTKGSSHSNEFFPLQ
jgi:hypothetical protein